MRDWFGRPSAVGITFLLAWSGFAHAAVVTDAPAPAVKPSISTDISGDPGLSSGRKAASDGAAVVQVPQSSTLTPTPAASTPPLSKTVNADDSAKPAPAKAVERAAPQVGPAPQLVEVAPVPEPSTGLLVCFACAAALARRDNRRSRRSRSVH